MTKHKRSGQKGRDKRPHTVASDPQQRGLQAFRAGRLDEAIAAWSPLAEQDARIAAAVAEAHFRRALMEEAGEDQVREVRCAVSLAPDDTRYLYHLGLALHRVGDLNGAVEAYCTVLERDPHWPGAELMLALATLEQNPEADLAGLPGSSTKIFHALAPVQAVLRREMPPPDTADPVGQLWYGLGLLQGGDAAAREILTDARPLPSKEATAVRRYYQGVAEARENDPGTALASWKDVYDQGTRPPWMLQNVASIATQRLREQSDGGNLDDAIVTAQQWLPLAANNPALAEALVQTLDRAALAAAGAGDWQRASRLWEEARQAASSSSVLGSPRSVLHNLALAYEAQERWMDAAEAWRALLRTRPRGTPRASTQTAADGTPGTATGSGTRTLQGGFTEEQWSWVRGRVIECYKRAGAPGQAVTIFRQAIKADPKDLDLRLQLADALLANEQEQAAINELQRLLQIDPHHIEAQLRLAAAHMARGEWHMAEHILRDVLRQHPDHATARQHLVRLLLDHGMSLLDSGFGEAARPLFEEGQRLAPEDYHFPLNLARIAASARKRKRAKQLLEETLSLGGEQAFTYIQVIECLFVLDDIKEAQAVVSRAESSVPLTSDFYVSLGVLLLERAAPRSIYSPLAPSLEPPADSAWTRMAEEALNHALALEPENPTIATQIAQALSSLRPDLMLRYAEEAVRRAPEDAHSLMVWGLAQALNDRTAEAKKTLRRAANLAQRAGDTALVRDIEALRRQVGTPFLRLGLSLMPLLDDLDLDADLFL